MEGEGAWGLEVMELLKTLTENFKSNHQYFKAGYPDPNRCMGDW